MNGSGFKLLRLLAAAILPSLAGTIVVFIGAVLIKQYGWILFLLLPVVIGFTSTIIYDPRHNESFGKCFLVAILSIVFVGFFIMITAVEGLVCLAMTLPIAVPLISVGVALAWTMTANWKDERLTGGMSVLLFLLMPLLMGFEASDKSTPTVHEVTSTVEIDAPIETVWKNVIEFPQIDEEPGGILALGFA